jgi:predicted nucleic acid-binding protein
VTIVVDASVALKWYWSEPDGDAALVLLGSNDRLIACRLPAGLLIKKKGLFPHGRQA